MSVRKYTPGPWKVTDDEYDAGLYRLHAITDPATDKANAQLIAAAPDLLEACKFARKQIKLLADKYIDDDVMSSSDWLKDNPAYQELKKAIAKAEGK